MIFGWLFALIGMNCVFALCRQSFEGVESILSRIHRYGHSLTNCYGHSLTNCLKTQFRCPQLLFIIKQPIPPNSSHIALNSTHFYMASFGCICKRICDLIQIMFQQRGGNRELPSRRVSLLREIQNSSRQSIKKRARSVLLRQLNHQQLDILLSKPVQAFGRQDLAQLVHFANAHFPRALAHLGNLVLDGVVKVAWLSCYELKAGFHPHWLWLIEVLAEQEYCTNQFLQHCVKALSPNRSAQTTKKALSILYKITVSGLCSLQVLESEAFVLAVLNSCLQEAQYSQVALGLVYESLRRRNAEQLSCFISQAVGSKLGAVLSRGSLCAKRTIKLLTCRIMAELSKKGVFLAPMSAAIIRMVAQAKEHNFISTLADLLIALGQFGSPQYLLVLMEQGLLVGLGALKQQLLSQQSEYQAGRIVEVGRQIGQKMKGLGYTSRGVYRELERFQLLKISNRMDIC